MTTMGKLNMEQCGTKTIFSVHEDQSFHSKTFCPYTLQGEELGREYNIQACTR